MGSIILMITAYLSLVTGQQIYNVKNAKGLRRDPEKGVFYAHFKGHQHHRLDIYPIKSTASRSRQERAQECAYTKPCFSFNLASTVDVLGKLTCELLPSDIYAQSNKFGAHPGFHHFSIKVSIVARFHYSVYLKWCHTTLEDRIGG